MRTYKHLSGLICCCLFLWLPRVAPAEVSVQWNQARDQMSANVNGLPLEDLLKRIAELTGWQVYMEPDGMRTPAVKFKDKPTGEALRLLLGDLNFAVVPETNDATHLYVFRTAMGNATRLIAAGPKNPDRVRMRRVPNELIVQLKPGVNIDDLARKLGAKVIGRIPGSNAYALQFTDQASADAALGQLASNSDVTNAGYNYFVDPPPVNQALSGAAAGTPQLQLKPPPGTGRLTIGLVDTSVQSLGSDLDPFVTKKLSVSGDTVPDSTTPLHGTTMANDILGSLSMATGGKTSAQIVSVDVFGNNAETTTFDVAAGITLAVNNGATWINVSLGSPGDSSLLQSIIQQASDKGIVIFAAAGNEPTGQPIYPAGYNGAVAVTALGQGGQLASYANDFPGVKVAAPGTSVMNYSGNTWVSQGTSVSTAFTTGLAAGMSESTGQTWGQIQPTLFNKLAVPASK